MKKNIQILLLITGILFFSSCKNDPNSTTTTEVNSEMQNVEVQSEEIQNEQIQEGLLYGSWNDNSEAALDFSIMEDGTARSDNMKTMLYKNWKLDGDQITFTIESIGNQTSSIDDETFTIEKLTEDELVLKNEGMESRYTKSKQ